MKFPLSVYCKEGSLAVQEIEYQEGLMRGPFMMNFLEESGLWKNRYSSSGILPVFESTDDLMVHELPFVEWLERYDQMSPFPETRTGFIFHMSRCGSTLFSEAAKNSAHTRVFSEPPIINALLSPELAMDDETRMRACKLAIVEMQGAAGAMSKLTLIKLRSWNIFRLRTILDCFPSSRSVFIHRDSREIYQSVRRKPPGWMRGFEMFAHSLGVKYDGRKDYSDDEVQCCSMLEVFCSYVDQIRPGAISALNYKQIKARFFEVMKSIWDVDFAPGESERVIASFARYSKSPAGEAIDFAELERRYKDEEWEIRHPDLHLRIDQIRERIRERF